MISDVTSTRHKAKHSAYDSECQNVTVTCVEAAKQHIWFIYINGDRLRCRLRFEFQTPWSRHPPRADTPWEQTPPRADTPLEQTPPRADTPQEQTPPGSRHPPGADTPSWEQTPPGSRPPQSRPPWEQSPLGAHLPRKQTTPPPGSRLRHTVNERPLRILLECILVLRSINM